MALRIRDLREDNDFTQAEIAALLNVSQATYSRYETESLSIPHSSLEILADYYHTSVDYLLGRTNIPEPYPKSKPAAGSGGFFSPKSALKVEL